MKLKKTFTIKISEKKLKSLKHYIVIHSQVLQEDGMYLVNYTRYNFDTYEQLVNKLVKEKYNDSAEFAILRKSINNPNNAEYIEYNAYVEDCKERARAFIEERKLILGK